ncbi:MAG: FkbM family methyltransferase [Rhodospirillales bacterium]|nr:FkbM family methyltransferase [Rhodospirillales bacterium]
MIIDQLTFRQRLTWVAHLWKACTKQHHKELAPLFARYLPEGAVVFDVGAHSGQFAKLFSGLTPQGRVFSFEPGSYARSILSQAVKFRAKNNVTIEPFGLGSQSASFVLNVPVKKSGSLGFGLSFVGDAAAAGRPVISETVTIRTIDEVVSERGLDRLDFIKADIEGFELEMLKGARQTLERLRPVVYVEVVDEHLRRAGGSARELFQLMDDHRYRQAELHTGTLLAPDRQEHGDLLFVPQP